MEIDSENQVQPAKLPETKPRAGYTLRLTLDLALQKEGEIALRKGMELAHALGNPGNGGAFLAMEPRTGGILAMGSYPSFNPNRFTNALSERELEEIEQLGVGAKSGEPEPAPLVDRATEGAYPTGSTFKPITAIGSLEAGVLDPYAGLGAGHVHLRCDREILQRRRRRLRRAGARGCAKVSSDTYFFTVGEMDNSHGEVIQHMAHELGIGRPTGIDLPSESEGTVPSPKWLAERNALEAKCTREHHGHSCEIVAEPGAPWSVGHNMDLAVGQGDLQTDPLQMAVAYSTLANAFMNNGEGWVPTPHLGDGDRKPQRGDRADAEVPAAAQGQAQPHQPRPRDGRDPRRHLAVGWHLAGRVVGLEPGQAPRLRQDRHRRTRRYVEQAWYMCILPDAGRPIVIAVTVEQGGFGDQAAAPVARLIASKWFNQPLKLVNGTSADK